LSYFQVESFCGQNSLASSFHVEALILPIDGWGNDQASVLFILDNHVSRILEVYDVFVLYRCRFKEFTSLLGATFVIVPSRDKQERNCGLVDKFRPDSLRGTVRLYDIVSIQFPFLIIWVVTPVLHPERLRLWHIEEVLRSHIVDELHNSS